ncbi:cytochrome c [Tautonia sociabilis]|uniref:Cytochrome c n=1 Tax=Tautonia sociabilis TaxID=2080755 RepID=A0A432MH45_9BACT|nr:cytochrome c [Tautonia sociabilis]RUL86309.1 hypothetical protein TsocGM_16405 [Tautonia sociabilis]
MRRSIPAATLATLALAMPLAARPRSGDDPPPIKQIMETLNKGPDSLTAAIGRNLDKSDPDWVALGEQCREYEANVEQLGRNVPPRGEPASWSRLTTAYLGNARALSAAVKAQDRQAALAAHGKIEQACARCHVNHKP